MWPDQAYTVAMDLLSILSLLLAFLTFFCGLRFSRLWSKQILVIFRLAISIVCLAVVTTGLACLHLVNNSTLMNLHLVGIRMAYIVDFLIGSLIGVAILITLATVSR